MPSRFFIILLFIVGIIGFFYIRTNIKEYAKDDLELTNHVRFSGIITSYNISDNHSFGIIGIKILDTNTKEFADSSIQRIFPYKIKGTYAEFYGFVPQPISVGDTVLLDSDTKKLKIYSNHHGLKVSASRISTDSYNTEFVRRHTKFK